MVLLCSKLVSKLEYGNHSLYAGRHASGSRSRCESIAWAKQLNLLCTVSRKRANSMPKEAKSPSGTDCKFCCTVQSSYQALPGNSMQARLRLAEMHPELVNSGGRSLHTNAFPGRAWERVKSEYHLAIAQRLVGMKNSCGCA